MEKTNRGIEVNDRKMNWVIEVNNEMKKMVDTPSEKEQYYWEKRSIYKVPACVTDLNKKAYRPQVVSFGPYHHGEEHLKAMEEHKRRALLHFLKRCGKGIELFVNSLAGVVQDLKDSYEPLDSVWKDDTSRFLQLMILDGCFMLEILRTSDPDDASSDDYAPSDPIFSKHGMLNIMPYIKRDMLMLENQLPMLVLHRLVSVERDQTKEKEELMNKLIHKFCFSNDSIRSMGKCLHVLDLYKKSLLQEDSCSGKTCSSKSARVTKHADAGGADEIIRSATELNEAGIWFKKNRSGSLKDISFKGGRGVLELPVIVVDDVTESMFLNLMAFERFHVGVGSEVTSYIFFMDNIIDNERDVALLNSRGIIQNAMGSDKAVAKLFNSLSKDITFDPESSLNDVHKRVSDYCKKPWNRWRANLIHTYFRNPWAILSLIAAIFLFALTIIQTIYTVHPFQNESPPDHSPPTVLPHPTPPHHF